jgi:hypothetical protein
LDSPYEYWKSPNGPWRKVFIVFWKKIREKFANTDDTESKNYWGSTSSQLFNKVSLTILAADFFQFISEGRGIPINAVDEIPGLVEEWLKGVKDNYFSRSWEISGIKKDSPQIRKQWSKLWVDYRKDPGNLPGVTQYRQNYSA